MPVSLTATYVFIASLMVLVLLESKDPIRHIHYEAYSISQNGLKLRMICSERDEYSLSLIHEKISDEE